MREILLVNSQYGDAFIQGVRSVLSVNLSNMGCSKTLGALQMKLLIALKTGHNQVWNVTVISGINGS